MAFVVPGLIYETLSERHRPVLQLTPLREMSRIALASVFLTGISVALLSAIRGLAPTLMPDPGRLLRDGSAYVALEYALIGRTVVVGLGLSCLLAWFAYALGPGREASVSRPHDTVWTVLHESTLESGRDSKARGRSGPRGGVGIIPVVEIRTRDNARYRGQVAAIDPLGSRADRMIALAQPIGVMRGDDRTTVVAPWERLLIPLDEVTEMYAAFGKAGSDRDETP